MRTSGVLAHNYMTRFSIITYNLLADCYVRVPGQQWNAFAHCAEQDLIFENRIKKIQNHLLEHNADIVCLQEVMYEKRIRDEDGEGKWGLPIWMDVFKEKGYECVMQGLTQKEWEKNSQRNEKMVGKPIPTGVASLYRSETWEEIEPSKHGSGSGSVLFLKNKRCPSLELTVGNTHLVGDPNKSDSQSQQLQGLQKNMAKRPQGTRIVCGDMNGDCAPDGAVGSWIAEQVRGSEEYLISNK